MTPKIRYKALVADQLSPADRGTILSEARTAVTGDDAFALQGKGPWGCEKLDLRGRVRVLRYKGAEVAIYFQRQITEIEPFPGDPLPAGIIQDPAEAWVRFELLGPSSKLASALSTKQRLQLARELEVAKLELEVVKEDFGTMETKLLKTQNELTVALEKIKEQKGAKREKVAV